MLDIQNTKRRPRVRIKPSNLSTLYFLIYWTTKLYQNKISPIQKTFCGCTAMFVLDLVWNPQNKFSCNAALCKTYFNIWDCCNTHQFTTVKLYHFAIPTKIHVVHLKMFAYVSWSLFVNTFLALSLIYYKGSQLLSVKNQAYTSYSGSRNSSWYTHVLIPCAPIVSPLLLTYSPGHIAQLSLLNSYSSSKSAIFALISN